MPVISPMPARTPPTLSSSTDWAIMATMPRSARWRSPSSMAACSSNGSAMTFQSVTGQMGCESFGRKPDELPQVGVELFDGQADLGLAVQGIGPLPAEVRHALLDAYALFLQAADVVEHRGSSFLAAANQVAVGFGLGQQVEGFHRLAGGLVPLFTGPEGQDLALDLVGGSRRLAALRRAGQRRTFAGQGVGQRGSHCGAALHFAGLKYAIRRGRRRSGLLEGREHRGGQSRHVRRLRRWPVRLKAARRGAGRRRRGPVAHATPGGASP